MDKSSFNKSEKDVYELLLRGWSYKEIASFRDVAVCTIATQASNIYRKKLVNSQRELMAERIKELENELSRYTT